MRMSAVLQAANLHRADLSRSDLRAADLTGTDLTGARLDYANLRGADLSGANLSGVALPGVELRGVTIDSTTHLDERWRQVWAIVNRPATFPDLRQANLRAACLIELGEFEAALNMFASADYDESGPYIQVNRARCFAALGQVAEAREAFRQAIDQAEEDSGSPDEEALFHRLDRPAQLAHESSEPVR